MKAAASLAVVAVLAFDAIALVVAHFAAADRAHSVAVVAATVCEESRGDVQKAFDEAWTAAARDGDVLLPEGFGCSRDGAVRLTLEHEATTLLVSRVGPLKHWVVATGRAELGPSS